MVHFYYTANCYKKLIVKNIVCIIIIIQNISIFYIIFPFFIRLRHRRVRLRLLQLIWQSISNPYFFAHLKLFLLRKKVSLFHFFLRFCAIISSFLISYCLKKKIQFWNDNLVHYFFALSAALFYFRSCLHYLS